MAQVKEGISLGDAYKFHRAKCKRTNKATSVRRQEYRDICVSFNKKLVDKVLNGAHVPLPFYMGIIRIVGRKNNLDKLKIDWAATKEYGFTCYHDNRDTDGNYFKWDWVRPTHLIKSIQHYTFKAARGNNAQSPIEKLGAKLKIPNKHKLYLVLKKRTADDYKTN